MDSNGAVKSVQHPHLGALVLNKTQAGLVLGFVVVGVVASFGVGFITGMWYQTSEHITPYEARPALAIEEQAEGQEMTFYSTLTTPEAGVPASGVAATPATKPMSRAPDAASQVPTRPATPAPAVKTGERLAASSAGPAPGSSTAPGALAGAKRDAGVPPPVGSSPPVVRPVPSTPEAASRLSGHTVAPVPPNTGERPPMPGGEALPTEKIQPVVGPSPARSSGAGYSVQVGSFRTPEQAEQLRSRLVQKGYPARVQTSVLPGKGLWYRVRVGNFPERLVADQTAQRLTTQERMSVIVAAEEGK